MINVFQFHVCNLLLRVHHHWIGGGVGLLVQLRAHDGLDLQLDRKHWLWGDPDHTVSILVLLKLRLIVTRTCNLILFKNRLNIVVSCHLLRSLPVSGAVSSSAFPPAFSLFLPSLAFSSRSSPRSLPASPSTPPPATGRRGCSLLPWCSPTD